MIMKKLTLILSVMLFAAFSASAQQQITGKVTNAETGEPIPGVSIVVKQEQTIGTTSDMDGNYSIEVPSDAETLVFSFVGMQTQEVPIQGRTTIDVQMQPTVQEMEEVVVTALGISREKKQLGYSVQEVGGEEVSEAQQSDAISALQGKVSGVQIRSSSNMGGSNKILIRGATSITGDNSPLIVVDGVPIDNSSYNSLNTQAGYGGYDYGNMLNDINPDEIKNISVLKGAAAALYGSRAANGVILIETKGAQQGKEDFTVSLSSSVEVSDNYLAPNMQDKYGGGTVVGGPNGFQQINVEGNDYLIPQYQVDQSWGPRYDEDVEVLHWDAWAQESYPDQYLQPRPWTAPENDVLDYWEMGVSNKNNIGISKTGEDYGIRFNFANTNADGKMPGSWRNKNNFKLTGNVDLVEGLKINAKINYHNQHTKGRPQIGYGANSVGQDMFMWGQRQLDYERLEDYKTNDGDQRTWNRISWDNSNPRYADNPYWTAYENYPEDQRRRIFGNFGAQYKINEQFTLEGNIYGDAYTFTTEERVAINSQAQPYYEETVRNRSEFNYEGRLNYSQDFGDISLSGVAGGNMRTYTYNMNHGETTGGLISQGVYSLTNSFGTPVVDDFTREQQINSLFAQASFSYKGWLNIDGSIRNDWSSALPADNNSYFYYGTSGSFIFSDLMNIDWMDLGKLRFGYTQVGNDTDPYRAQTTYAYDIDGTFRSAPRLLIPNDLSNPNLKPEITTTTEGGLDFALFNNRINLNATYFNKATTNQIIPLEVSKATGYQTQIVNAGKLTSKGLEVSLGVVPVRTENWNWRLNFNYTRTKMIVNELVQGVEAIDLIRAPFGGVFLRASEGDEYGQLWGYDYIYDDNGNKVLTGQGGLYRREPGLQPLGSVYPDYNLGIRNSLSYKNFNFSFLVDIQEGGKFYSLTHMWGMYSGMFEATAQTNDKGNNIRQPVSEGGGINLDGVVGDVTFNDDGTYEVTNVEENTGYTPGQAWSQYHYHRFGTPSAQSVFDASYIKLREVTIGYTIPEMFNGTVNNLKISLYGRNLFTFGLAMDGFDPEMTVAGTGNIQGIDGGLQPMARSVGLNVQMEF